MTGKKKLKIYIYNVCINAQHQNKCCVANTQTVTISQHVVTHIHINYLLKTKMSQ